VANKGHHKRPRIVMSGKCLSGKARSDRIRTTQDKLINSPEKLPITLYHRLRGSASPVLTATHHSYGNLAWLSDFSVYV